MSYLWQLFLDIMYSSLHVQLFMDQQYHKTMHGAPEAGSCLLISIGGCRAAVTAAAEWPCRVQQRL